MPYLFSERFVAYETPLEEGIRGNLRFKVDCSSQITAEQLRHDEQCIFSQGNQATSSKRIGINFTSCQRVSGIQVELLQEMLSTCKAELLVDLCEDDVIKLKNPWNAVMVMKREATTDRTILQGDKTVVQNFSRQVNSFF
jgi:hypothetical protein